MRLTLVVCQCLVGTFDSIMVNFLIGHYTVENGKFPNRTLYMLKIDAVENY